MSIYNKLIFQTAIDSAIDNLGGTLCRYYSDGFVTVDNTSWNIYASTLPPFPPATEGWVIPESSFLVISRQPIMIDSDNFGDVMPLDIRENQILSDPFRLNNPRYFRFNNQLLDSKFDNSYAAQYSRLYPGAETIFPGDFTGGNFLVVR